ncbi:hypothetical protein TCSYLVIO_009805 [Trypanosoma cruzi]|nr:hypothetical protein TCSYLVIO_009805 [Trypanosoma cruzi]
MYALIHASDTHKKIYMKKKEKENGLETSGNRTWRLTRPSLLQHSHRVALGMQLRRPFLLSLFPYPMAFNILPPSFLPSMLYVYIYIYIHVSMCMRISLYVCMCVFFPPVPLPLPLRQMSSVRFSFTFPSLVLSNAGWPRKGHVAQRNASPLAQFPQPPAGICGISTFFPSASIFLSNSARPHVQFLQARRRVVQSSPFVVSFTTRSSSVSNASSSTAWRVFRLNACVVLEDITPSFSCPCVYVCPLWQKAHFSYRRDVGIHYNNNNKKEILEEMT